MENLFSYGTLQLEKVQLETFGRLLNGQRDILPGYKRMMIKIEDEAVVAASGEAYHPVVSYTGNAEDEIRGIVYQVTEEELKHADEYEVDSYKRVAVVLKSGKPSWVYVSAEDR